MAETTIPFFDYAALYRDHHEELAAEIEDVLQRGAFILQRDLDAFETELAAFVGARHVIGVANGTDGLLLALRAAGVQEGDEVILPSHTYVATAAAVHFLGARPVLVECGPDHLMDPRSTEAAITSRTRALMPVHLNGRTCAMDDIQEICERNSLLIVEDAAQAVGSLYRERAAGTFGVAAAFSFYPAKVLGCFGDGGAVVTNDDEVAHTVRLLRDHGRDASGDVVTWGFNSRLDNLQAAILRVKLHHLPKQIERRREIARRYEKELAQLPGLVTPPGPDADDDRYDVYQNYEIEVDDRAGLQAHLSADGIGTIVQWGGSPVHRLQGLGFETGLPITEELFRRCLLLPMHPALTDEQVERVSASVGAFCGR